MDISHVTLVVFSVALGAFLTYGAIRQLQTGGTWGATGKGRIRRDEEPGYFWYIFVARIILGPVLMIGGIWSI